MSLTLGKAARALGQAQLMQTAMFVNLDEVRSGPGTCKRGLLACITKDAQLDRCAVQALAAQGQEWRS
jgi:hypothetical protein